MTASTLTPTINQHSQLYSISLKIKKFPHPLKKEGTFLANVWMRLLRKEESPWSYDFPSLIQGYVPPTDEDHMSWYSEDYLRRECFTLEEVRAIEVYLVRHPYPGSTVHLDPVELPTEYAAADQCRNSWDYYDFDEDEEFDCPIPFVGVALLGEESDMHIVLRKEEEEIEMDFICGDEKLSTESLGEGPSSMDSFVEKIGNWTFDRLRASKERSGPGPDLGNST